MPDEDDDQHTSKCSNFYLGTRLTLALVLMLLHSVGRNTYLLLQIHNQASMRTMSMKLNMAISVCFVTAILSSTHVLLPLYLYSHCMRYGVVKVIGH